MISEKTPSKTLWELTMREIQWLYQHRHINNYVYAGWMALQRSNPPAGIPVRLKKGKVPESLLMPAQQIADLSQYLGQDDASLVRIHATFRSYQLFEAFRELPETEMEQTLDLLSCLAYIPLLAERNDNFQLWPYPVLRPMTNQIKEKFSLILSSDTMDPLLSYKFNEPLKGDEAPDYRILRYVHHVVSTLVTLIENDAVSSDEIAMAFLQAERVMIAEELKHGLRQPGTAQRNFQTGTQIRARGTLYLYGGTFFEHRGDMELAYAWYTRNILYPEFPDDMVYYLTDLKATERLISAYRICADKHELPFLKSFIISCLHQSFRKASEFATTVLDFLAQHPDTDLSKRTLVPPNGKRLQYAGESVREVYLIALYYRQVLEQMDYRHLGYEKILNRRTPQTKNS
jgi:hypothetical protein